MDVFPFFCYLVSMAGIDDIFGPVIPGLWWFGGRMAADGNGGGGIAAVRPPPPFSQVAGPSGGKFWPLQVSLAAIGCCRAVALAPLLMVLLFWNVSSCLQVLLFLLHGFEQKQKYYKIANRYSHIFTMVSPIRDWSWLKGVLIKVLHSNYYITVGLIKILHLLFKVLLSQLRN